MDAAGAGELGGTYCGSPLGCSAGLAVLEVMEKEELNKRAEVIGQKVMEKFQHFYNRFEVVGDARGLGAMCALEFVKDKESKEPAKQLVGEILRSEERRVGKECRYRWARDDERGSEQRGIGV